MTEFEGTENVLRAIQSLANKRKIQMAMGKACALVERDAKQKVPKGTGALRRSITSKVDVDNSEVVGIVYTSLEYAPYVEFGTGLFAEGGGRTDVPWNYQDDEGNWHSTSGMHPQPFMRPAINENREEVKRIIQEGITND